MRVLVGEPKRSTGTLHGHDETGYGSAGRYHRGNTGNNHQVIVKRLLKSVKSAGRFRLVCGFFLSDLFAEQESTAVEPRRKNNITKKEILGFLDRKGGVT